MSARDSGKSTRSDSRVTASRIILFAQSLSVIASIAGLVGLIVAYKSLPRDAATSNENPPTIF